MEKLDTSKYLADQFKHLQKDYDALTQCNRCGFCETVCPTYVVSGKETLSPRGRNQALRQILEGKLTKAVVAQEVFSTCLTCHACTNVCYSAVPVGKLMGQAKQIVLKQAHPVQDKLQRLSFALLLHFRPMLRVIVWPGFLLKRLGIVSLARRLGILKLFGSTLESADLLIEKPSLALDCPQTKKQDGSARPRVSYFSGCGMQMVYPDNAKTMTELLGQCSSEVQCANKVCCGMIPSSAGNLDVAKKFARKLMGQFKAEGQDAIVVNDDSCAGFMKSYGSLLQTSQALEFEKKVYNLSEYLVKQNWPDFFQTESVKKVKVTWHDACQMGNGQQSFTAPRALLKQIPGVEFVEMQESNWCCGGAGTYCLKHPRLADDILERKLDNIERSGADIVLGQAASCLMHIAYGLRQKGLDQRIQVMHLADFLKMINSK